MTASLTLYEPQSLLAHEDHLQAMVDTLESVTPEQEEVFLADFTVALAATVQKRDAVGQFLSHVENQIAFGDREISRIRQRMDQFVKIKTRLEGYVSFVIASFGKDAKGKYRKLEGETVSFSLRACPPSIEIREQTKVPDDYKSVTVTLPAFIWSQLLEFFPAPDDIVGEELRIADTKCHAVVSKTAVKAALDAGCTVEGVERITDKHSLVIK